MTQWLTCLERWLAYGHLSCPVSLPAPLHAADGRDDRWVGVQDAQPGGFR